MKLLLDTHLLIWGIATRTRLPMAAAQLLSDHGNQLVFSSASIWEIAIKQSSGRLNIGMSAMALHSELLRHHYVELPVVGLHAVAISKLPKLHKDPFDRILVAQALFEGLVLLTADRMVAQYPGAIYKV